MLFKKLLIAAIILFFSTISVSALSYTDIGNSLSDIFYNLTDDNEGTTTFRSLLIPFGGRTESLGTAFTGLCDDVSYLRYNPAGASLQKQTQFSIFHNTWIADSKLETLAFTTRSKNLRDLGIGGFISCFYVPFTEYNLFGDRTAASYYTETVAGFNLSYNFLAGYDFKGLSLGTTIKAAYRGMPDYTDNDTNEVIPYSGFKQSGFSLMADVGLLLQFNFLKYYYSRDPNIRIGISAQNLGFSLIGNENIQIDDSLPTTFTGGFSIKLIKPITLTADYTQPFDFNSPSTLLTGYFNTGIDFQFSSFLNLMGGFSLKGGNPRFSTGFEFEVAKIRLNFNYTLDFTTSFAPFNKLSLSAKINLGDKGRSIIDSQVDEYYQLGLKYYADAKYEDAIFIWQEALKLNKRFDPALQGIESAEHQINMFRMIRESLLLD